MNAAQSAIAAIDGIDDLLAILNEPPAETIEAIQLVPVTQPLDEIVLVDDEVIEASDPDEIVEMTLAEALAEDALLEAANAKAAASTSKEASKKAAREAAAAKKVADREAKKAAREADGQKVPERKFYGNNKVQRLQDQFGDQLKELLILTDKQAKLTGKRAELAYQDALGTVDNAGAKVKARMVYLLEYAGNKAPELNEVAHRALQVLATDGYIKSGDKGNLHANLIAKPYSQTSARAMGNNTLSAMTMLEVVLFEGGQYVANPDSRLLRAITARLGLEMKVPAAEVVAKAA